MKRWNHWLPRAFAALIALIALGVAVPWNSVPTYLFSPVTNLRDVAVLWLVGVHCLIQRRLRWFGWSLMAGAVAVFSLSLVSYIYEGPIAGTRRPLAYDIKVNIEWLSYTGAIIALLLFFRLRGMRRVLQFATAAAFALELIIYWFYYFWAYRALPHEASHVIWNIRGCAGLAGYIGLLATTYNVALYHEPLRPLVPINDSTARVKVECPRCMRMQELPLGKSVCKDCGVNIRIDIEDRPCAKCGYTLRGVPGLICSECGTPFGVQAELEQQPNVV